MNLSEINIEEINLENMGSLAKEVKVIILILMTLGSFALGIFFFCQADFVSWKHAINNKQKLKTELSESYHKAKNSFQYEQQIENIKKEQKRISIQLPEKDEVATLLENITSQAAFTNVQPIKLVPGEAKKVSFYMVQPFKLTVLGKYHDIANFVSGIVSLPRIITVHDFDMSIDVKKLKEKKYEDFAEAITMTVEIKIYWYDEKKIDE